MSTRILQTLPREKFGVCHKCALYSEDCLTFKKAFGTSCFGLLRSDGDPIIFKEITKI